MGDDYASVLARVEYELVPCIASCVANVACEIVARRVVLRMRVLSHCIAPNDSLSRRADINFEDLRA